jgi:hypothetical protein
MSERFNTRFIVPRFADTNTRKLIHGQGLSSLGDSAAGSLGLSSDGLTLFATLPGDGLLAKGGSQEFVLLADDFIP